MINSLPSGRTYNVVEYGADPKGLDDSTGAINEAITQASETRGIVYIPPGNYLSRNIILRSNVMLLIDKGAVVKFSTDYKSYPIIETRREGVHHCGVMPLIFGKDVRNVRIIGEGVFDGQGYAWWPIRRFRVTEDYWRRLVESGGVVGDDGKTWWPTRNAMEGAEAFRKITSEGGKPSTEDCERYREFFRPQLLQLYNAENVTIEGVTFKDSPMWTIHILYSRHVTLINTSSIAPDYSPNTDGVVVDSSSDVEVRGCMIDVGDDCLVIKSGRDEEGRRIGIPSENIHASGCLMKRGHGGFVIGSEMSGGVRNVSIQDSVFDGTERGVRIKTTRGRGGLIENVYVNNIYMRNIIHEAVVVDMFYEKRPVEPVSERTPKIRGVVIRNTSCDGADQAVLINGLPEMPIEDIIIENTRITSNKGIHIENASSIRLSNVKVNSRAIPVITMSNVRNITLDDVSGLSME
ncbi:glycoside hydrolase family 28 protein [Caldivirga maquilingensis]|uniref:Glycoside hydrolase family 28 n=1 Tax=Caldivirga maquilingensis (strain ATCC 700844 / DSM 13496 / JCM 10307 / IC-167) TaxID=397948 RepID=A8MAP2_CALMQ|nr:glycoside hydrolase family 28 protein [Caldivirga maquilingensis]ABW01078.1 glycoside hydrolase family 28 [Caldivirga maquilingensis IC-167]